MNVASSNFFFLFFFFFLPFETLDMPWSSYAYLAIVLRGGSYSYREDEETCTSRRRYRRRLLHSPCLLLLP